MNPAPPTNPDILPTAPAVSAKANANLDAASATIIDNPLLAALNAFHDLMQTRIAEYKVVQHNRDMCLRIQQIYAERDALQAEYERVKIQLEEYKARRRLKLRTRLGNLRPLAPSNINVPSVVPQTRV
ncbi:hypothetical protein MKEN_00308700 [Mycena kentingensis (nom. inval.)]|nr:hypothetical protein MKEN_00308700 [Mycena kentingensis (nom. inval.)]